MATRSANTRRYAFETRFAITLILTIFFSDSERDTDTDDDEDEVDKDLFLARLAVAQKRLKDKEFKAAETQFEACLADVAVINSLPQHEVVDLKLDLATACRGAGSTTRQQSILNGLLKLDLPKIQELHLKHTLAVAYLDDFQLDSARSYASEAMKGRKKLLGRRHESYFETLSLLVTICRAQDDNDSADAYQGLLPTDYHNHAVCIFSVHNLRFRKSIHEILLFEFF